MLNQTKDDSVSSGFFFLNATFVSGSWPHSQSQLIKVIIKYYKIRTSSYFTYLVLCNKNTIFIVMWLVGHSLLTSAWNCSETRLAVINIFLFGIYLVDISFHHGQTRQEYSLHILCQNSWAERQMEGGCGFGIVSLTWL